MPMYVHCSEFTISVASFSMVLLMFGCMLMKYGYCDLSIASCGLEAQYDMMGTFLPVGITA